ncbi:MAG: DUF4097 family beta strand repeat-containing protein [Halanaeroarchaeum sp.]
MFDDASSTDDESPRTTTRRRLLAGTATLATVGLAGCTASVLESRTRTVERAVDAAAVDRVVVDEATDDVAIRIADDDRVHVLAEKHAVGGTDLDAFTLHTETAGRTLRVSTDRPRVVGFGGGSVPIRLRVPAGVGVDRVETADGALDLADTAGDATLSTGDGDVAVRGHDGDLDVETADGSVSIEGVDGRVSVETADGNVRLVDVATVGTVETADGSVVVGVDHLEAPATIHTADGEVQVRLGANVSAVLDAETADGRVVGMGVAGGVETASETRFVGSVGGGGPRLTIRTGDGDIVLSR